MSRLPRGYRNDFQGIGARLVADEIVPHGREQELECRDEFRRHSTSYSVARFVEVVVLNFR